jgi:hypothetical protein|tara:strand:+ start:1897 stop:2010 length:114 start_codon:yes stop_codon:yes gene_type:complete
MNFALDTFVKVAIFEVSYCAGLIAGTIVRGWLATGVY